MEVIRSAILPSCKLHGLVVKIHIQYTNGKKMN